VPANEKIFQPPKLGRRQLRQFDFETDRAGLVSALDVRFKHCSAGGGGNFPIELKRDLIEARVCNSLIILHISQAGVRALGACCFSE
jgi:hypothetical protein